MSTTKISHDPLSPEEFIQFKGLLTRFIHTQFGPVCSTFDILLANASDEDDLENVFINQRDDVYEKLGGELCDEDEIWDLERKIERLERENEELEYSLEQRGLEEGSTLNDEYKIIFFNEYSNQYSPWELEHILKNGKQFLNENPLYIGHTHPTLFDSNQSDK
jgi:hypothetical protein